jgi:hypothetical protein
MVMDKLELWKLIKPVFFYDEKGKQYYPYTKDNSSIPNKMFDTEYKV